MELVSRRLQLFLHLSLLWSFDGGKDGGADDDVQEVTHGQCDKPHVARPHRRDHDRKHVTVGQQLPVLILGQTPELFVITSLLATRLASSASPRPVPDLRSRCCLAKGFPQSLLRQ